MQEVKVGLFGSVGAGKSALCVQYVQGIFVGKYEPIMENSYRKVAKIDGKQYLLEILDTSGNLFKVSNFIDLYVKHTQCFFFIFSINNRKSFDEVAIHFLRTMLVREGEKIVCVLVGTKSDLESERQVPIEEAEELARELDKNCSYFETSGLKLDTITPVFEAVVRQLNVDQPQANKPKNVRKPGCLLM